MSIRVFNLSGPSLTPCKYYYFIYSIKGQDFSLFNYEIGVNYHKMANVFQHFLSFFFK